MKIRIEFALFAILWGSVAAEAQSPAAADSSSEKTTASSESSEIKLETAPRPINPVRPEYPMKGRKKRHGTVRLRAVVTKEGTLRDVAVVSGKKELAAAALDAVRQWHYVPAKTNGVPKEVPHEITVDFTDEDGVRLGTDDIPQDVPMEPSEEILAMLAAGEIFRVGHGVLPPKPIYAPDPDYPEMARKNRLSGMCEFGAVVGTSGQIQSAWLLRPLGWGLDEGAYSTLKQWKFEPATKNGKPVAVIINIETTFKLY